MKFGRAGVTRPPTRPDLNAAARAAARLAKFEPAWWAPSGFSEPFASRVVGGCIQDVGRARSTSMADWQRAVCSVFNGLTWRRFDGRPIPSATCPNEMVLLIRLRPDFSVVFEGYAGEAGHRPRREEGRNGLSGLIFSGPVDCAFLVL